MKRNVIFIILCVCLILCTCKSLEADRDIWPPDIHSAEDSVTWTGSYYGIVPAASGQGIGVNLILHDTDTYELQYHYINRAASIYTYSGSFTWADDGTTITLEGVEDFPKYYFVNQDYIIMLDMEGKRVTGELADNYVLNKEK